jgi:ABC-type iron transport system FetAB permease component
VVLLLGVFPAEARHLVPVGGMVIGNAMTAAAVALNRLGDEVHDNAGAAPVDAVRLQLALLHVLLGAVAIAALVAVALARRKFFTAEHQLREIAQPRK